MTREEHNAIIQQMLTMVTPENQATASQLLTQLSDDYNTTLSTSEQLTTRNGELEKNNETLRSVNADLFLKVGQTNANNQNLNQNQNQNQNLNQNQEEPKLTYEALFNEKGELI